MNEITLSDLIKDVSVAEGAETGFMFQIRCPHCKGIWESDFTPYSGGGWLGGGGLFKKTSGTVQSPEVTSAKNKALKEALAHAEDEFVYCKGCMGYVCFNCWNNVRELCLGCCVTSAMSAYDKALKEQADQVKAEQEASCTKCGTPAPGAKFCPKCGEKIVPRGVCVQCSAKLAPDALFCTQCGKKVA